VVFEALSFILDEYSEVDEKTGLSLDSADVGFIGGNKAEAAAIRGGPDDFGEYLNRFFLKHLEIQLDDAVGSEGAGGFQLHSAGADIEGFADIWVAVVAGGATVLPPHFDLTFEVAPFV